MRGVRQNKAPHGNGAPKHVRIPQVPIEWHDGASWRLPSGMALAEFALQAGFLAPVLFRTEMGLRTSSGARKQQTRFVKEGSR